ncbi:MAG TPA: amidohydrolase family protein, partial [Terriglobia bacterium]|nr:amidohydrolase family protein [Terriglobia bacterium]
ANPDAALIAAVVRLTDLVPSLRVVIDHLPELEQPTDLQGRKELQANLRELGARPQVYAKVSEVLHPVNGRVRTDPNSYLPFLDELWAIFGEDRLVYGSDWPNSDHSAPFRDELRVVRQYFSKKGRAAAEKVFWKNSIAAYRWAPRDARQRELHTAV